MSGIESKPERDFCLIETVLWDPELAKGSASGLWLLDRHLARLERSAGFFGFPFDQEEIANELSLLNSELMKRLDGKDIRSSEKLRIRCVLDKGGRFSITDVSRLHALEEPVTADISTIRTVPEDMFLYHKTTNRDMFDRERRRLRKRGLFETIFVNSRHEITQGTITNCFLDMGEGRLLTPHISSGLLPGTLREKLIDTGRAEEHILTLDDLNAASQVYLGNSVRGLIRANIIVQ